MKKKKRRKKWAEKWEAQQQRDFAALWPYLVGWAMVLVAIFVAVSWPSVLEDLWRPVLASLALIAFGVYECKTGALNFKGDSPCSDS